MKSERELFQLVLLHIFVIEPLVGQHGEPGRDAADVWRPNTVWQGAILRRQ